MNARADVEFAQNVLHMDLDRGFGDAVRPGETINAKNLLLDLS